MLNEMDEQFELWWDGYQGLPLFPADIGVVNFQDAFRAGYEAGHKKGLEQGDYLEGWEEGYKVGKGEYGWSRKEYEDQGVTPQELLKMFGLKDV